MTLPPGGDRGDLRRAASAEKLLSIEAGRGVAALLVLFYHVDKYYFHPGSAWAGGFLDGFFGFGHAGVEFFFVLSGLLITRIHFDDFGKPGRFGEFWRKRYARIYPFYWFCTLVLLAVRFGLTGAAAVDPRVVASSFALVGSDPQASFIIGSWTLFHEMIFYAFFGLAIWRPRLGIPLTIVWFAAIIVIGSNAGEVAYPLRSINILFLFGVLAALALRRERLPPPGLVVMAGIAVFAVTAIDDVAWQGLTREWQIIGYGLGAALGLVGLVSLERRGKLPVPRLLVLAGQASYSIYLTHIMVLSLVGKVAVRLRAPDWLPAPLAFVLLAAAGMVAGIAVHFLIERRLVRIARRLLVHDRNARPVAARDGVVRPVDSALPWWRAKP